MCVCTRAPVFACACVCICMNIFLGSLRSVSVNLFAWVLHTNIGTLQNFTEVSANRNLATADGRCRRWKRAGAVQSHDQQDVTSFTFCGSACPYASPNEALTDSKKAESNSL